MTFMIPSLILALVVVFVTTASLLPIDGEWSCTQAVIFTTGTGSPSPFTMTISGGGGVFYDELDCSSGCTFNSNFSYTGYALTGFYFVDPSSAHGIWSLVVNESGSLLGLTTSFASGDSYLIQCASSSSLRTYEQRTSVEGNHDNALYGIWDGTEVRVSASGLGAVSQIMMNVSGSSAVFTDDFGCENGCSVDTSFGFFPNGSLGYYYDPDGSVHGIWLMYAASDGAPFTFTTSFESGYSYIVDNKPQPSCTAPKNCLQQMPTPFASTCGAWIAWRYLNMPLVKFIHQAFTYDNVWANGTQPSLGVNSGYYSCGDNHEGTGGCVGCGFSDVEDSSSTTCLGRVCQDTPDMLPQYQLVLNTTGLSDVYPDETSKTCWFLNPLHGEAMNCEALWSAEKTIQTTWNECENMAAPLYQLTSHNCRDYVMAVVAEYCSSTAGRGTKVCTC